MRKTLSIIGALCAAVLCLTSCLKEKVGDFVYEYEIQASLKNEDDWNTLKAYFEENFVNAAKSRTFHGTYNEAYNQGVEIYEQEIKTVNQDLILDCIKETDDIVVLYAVISGDKVKETIKATYWNYEYKKYIRPDSE